MRDAMLHIKITPPSQKGVITLSPNHI